MDRPLLALTRHRDGGLPGRSPPHAAAHNMRQLVQLRWLAVAGQLIAILVAHFGLGVTLPLVPMIGIVMLLALANLLFMATLRRSWLVPGEVLLALLLDVAALTVQLYLSGGATNPFISLYLVQVVLGIILLPAVAVWLLTAIACLCAAFLIVDHLPLVLPPRLDGAPVDVLLAGQWISFAMVAVLLVLFITRISRNLRARDAYVAELGQRAAEEDGIVRMGLFASGAAHELGTPLSSLAVLVSDWRRHPAIGAEPDIHEELEVAEAEIERCKQIVSNILHSAGQARGEAMGSTPVQTLLDRIVAEWNAHPGAVPLRHAFDWTGTPTVAAEPALRQAIWALLENAAEVSPEGISLDGRVADGRLMISIEDQGRGFADAQLARIGQLYESTKGPGHGLGMFLASNVARRLGGRLEAENRAEGGAVVRLVLPLATGPSGEG